MIDIKYNGVTYSIKNNIYEFTIDEFEDISIILNKQDIDNVDKWFEIFSRLNIPKEIINSLNKDEFLLLIDEFVFDFNLFEINKEIKFNNKKYKAYEKDLRISVKDILLIESCITLNPNKFIAEVIAILYKSKEEENIKMDINYIRNKAKIIRNEVKSNLGIPILNLISMTILNNLKSNINE